MRNVLVIISTLFVVSSANAARDNAVIGGLHETRRGLEDIGFLLSQNMDDGELCYTIGSLRANFVSRALGPDDSEIITYFKDLESIKGYCLRKEQDFHLNKTVSLHDRKALAEASLNLISRIDPIIKRYDQNSK